MLVDHILKTKKEFRNSNKQEKNTIFIKMNLIKFPFSMIWLMEVLKIYQEEQILIKFWEIRHLILQKNPKYNDYQRESASMVYKFFDKKSKRSGVNIGFERSKQLA